MQKKSKTSLFTSIKNVANSYFKNILNIYKLASLEALLASKTLMRLVGLFIVMFIFAISTWLSLLLLLYVVLIYFQFSAIFSASMMLLINLIAMLSLGIAAYYLKKRFAFSATRRELRKFRE